MSDNRTLSLFSHPAPFSNQTTSREAARSIQHITGRLCVTVLREIAKAGANGLTSDEVEQILAMPHQTASARVNQLMKDGAIVDSGTKRLTRSRRKAIVWVASEFGKLALHHT